MPWVWTRVKSTPLESLATSSFLSVTGAQAKDCLHSKVPPEVWTDPQGTLQCCGTRLTPTRYENRTRKEPSRSVPTGLGERRRLPLPFKEPGRMRWCTQMPGP